MSIPKTLYWLRSGCIGVAPSLLKMRMVRSYLREYHIDDFVETGTFLGDTLAYVAKSGAKCTSIELSNELFDAACVRFRGKNNVKLLHGDSGRLIPELLVNIDNPVLFWLDGHFSGGVTASATIHTPISSELDEILNHSVKQHVVLIDDARLFDGTNGYPHIDELLSVIRRDGNYIVEVSMDIIRLVPKVSL